jgi:ABC-2 type transport system permease protein
MRKVLRIAARDYIAAVRTKSFVISLLFLPTIMLGSALVQWLLIDKGEDKPQRFAVVDRTPGQALFPTIEAAVLRPPPWDHAGSKPGSRKRTVFTVERVEPAPDTRQAVERQRLALSARVSTGEFTGFLEVGPEVLTGTPTPDDDRAAVRYQSNILISEGFPRLAVEAINENVQRRRSAELGVVWNNVERIQRRIPLVSLGLSRVDAASQAVTEASEKSRLISIFVPIGLVLLMFMMVFSGSTPLLQGVAEEKGLRIAELLLSSVRPFELMAGKLLGNIGVGLTTITLYLTAAYLAAHRYGFDQLLSPGLLAWFLVFQVLGVLIYGSLFMAVGAACNDSKQIQTLLMPITLLAMSPLLALVSLIQDTTSPLATWLSFFPFATPMLMVLRIAIPPGIPWWQPALGALLMVVTAAGCVYAAGRIFRLGLLLQGKGADVRQMLRWVFRG